MRRSWVHQGGLILVLAETPVLMFWGSYLRVSGGGIILYLGFCADNGMKPPTTTTHRPLQRQPNHRPILDPKWRIVVEFHEEAEVEPSPI